MDQELRRSELLLGCIEGMTAFCCPTQSTTFLQQPIEGVKKRGEIRNNSSGLDQGRLATAGYFVVGASRTASSLSFIGWSKLCGQGTAHWSAKRCTCSLAASCYALSSVGTLAAGAEDTPDKMIQWPECHQCSIWCWVYPASVNACWKIQEKRTPSIITWYAGI